MTAPAVTPWAHPSLEQFVRHAQSFGVECVAETAARYLTGAERDRLRIELDAIEAARATGRFTVGKRRRRTEVETARYAAALAQELAEQGLGRVALEQRVADKLGVSDAYARRALKLARTMSQTAENAPRKPTVQAVHFATKPESSIGVPLGGFARENAP